MTTKLLDAFGLLNELDVSKSMGHDEMPSWLPEETVDFVANLLSICFGLSTTHGRLPGDWKNTTVIPNF